MKYWNKQHTLREQKWYTVTLPTEEFKNPLFPNFTGWTIRPKFDKLKRELQLLDSPGKFYMSTRDGVVYFEREQDAIYFSLKYL